MTKQKLNQKQEIFMADMASMFGSNVFNLKTMKERLPRDTYKTLKKTI